MPGGYGAAIDQVASCWPLASSTLPGLQIRNHDTCDQNGGLAKRLEENVVATATEETVRNILPPSCPVLCWKSDIGYPHGFQICKQFSLNLDCRSAWQVSPPVQMKWDWTWVCLNLCQHFCFNSGEGGRGKVTKESWPNFSCTWKAAIKKRGHNYYYYYYCHHGWW